MMSLTYASSPSALIPLHGRLVGRNLNADTNKIPNRTWGTEEARSWTFRRAQLGWTNQLRLRSVPSERRFLRLCGRNTVAGGTMRGQHSPVGASSEKVPIAQRALTNFLELPTVPIGSYVSSPISGLHVLDPRVKQAWLAALLLFPPNGTAEEKVAVSFALALVTAAALPNRVYLPQLTAVVGLCAILFVFTILGADSIMPVIQIREPPAAEEGLHALPELEQVYHYVLLHLGPLQVTRKGVNLAVSSSCLTFTVLQSAHLIMCTTTPEAMASGMRWYLRPLRLFRAPVDEIIFTLLLSLRFTSIVFEEIRNISLGLAARGVDWRGLGWRGTVTLASSLLSRTLESLFVTSQAVADAVVARGFAGAEEHRFFSPRVGARCGSFTRVWDVTAIATLLLFVSYFSVE